LIKNDLIKNQLFSCKYSSVISILKADKFKKKEETTTKFLSWIAGCWVKKTDLLLLAKLLYISKIIADVDFN